MLDHTGSFNESNESSCLSCSSNLFKNEKKDKHNKHTNDRCRNGNCSYENDPMNTVNETQENDLADENHEIGLE